MKKYWHIALMLFGLLCVLPSCKDDEEEDPLPIDEDWKNMNIAAFNARVQDVKENDDLFTIASESGNGQIVCKILKKGEGTETIYYTSKVNCYYKGCFVADEEGNLVENRDSVLVQGEVFDSVSEEEGDDPSLFTGGADLKVETSNGTQTTSFADGFTTALQHMHVGDVWEVWIPYQLGYGVAGLKDNGVEVIKPYTTLVFQIEVASMEEQ